MKMTEALTLANRLRSEQVSALFQNLTLGVIGAALGALVLASAMIHLGALSWITGVSWILYIFACAGAHLLLRHLYYRVEPNDDQWKIWAAWFTTVSLAEGIGWGWASVSLVGDSDRFSLQMLVMVVTLNIAGGAIPAFSSYLPAFFALFLPTTIPSVFWSIASRNLFPEAIVMLLLMLIFIVAMGGLGVRANQNFKELVGLRIRTNELANDLRKQKELAEEASLAKSTFLAAASHDLRQPVHALGMFVGALRGVALTPDAVRLVERIEESTNAMDSLFSAILDISRLDAGVVDVQARPFAIQPLLDRICAEYSAEAQEKSITLVCHACRAAVHTDPLLMERIVRNLLSNAVRYTISGRVVVGCRRRVGKIRVEVWDTGPGIPAAERERVFQEYFQLQNPERDRTMGLGLGLAIVRRLSNLLSCPVILRSELGRGCCFSVEMPEATAPVFKEATTSGIALETTRGLVLVIDDEAAIRDAMHSLLTGWGYAVITAGSGAEMLVELAKCPMRPDVIICDYRLRGEENGIGVIQQLQAEFNEAIPAMLITGDTAADRLVEARSSGLLLLHKPVLNSRLRAAIVNLIAASDRNKQIENETTLSIE
jgi:signal transduction histidine kinase/CheY-like chemotaxis protein